MSVQPPEKDPKVNLSNTPYYLHGIRTETPYVLELRGRSILNLPVSSMVVCTTWPRSEPESPSPELLSRHHRTILAFLSPCTDGGHVGYSADWQPGIAAPVLLAILRESAATAALHLVITLRGFTSGAACRLPSSQNWRKRSASSRPTQLILLGPSFSDSHAGRARWHCGLPPPCGAVRAVHAAAGACCIGLALAHVCLWLGAGARSLGGAARADAPGVRCWTSACSQPTFWAVCTFRARRAHGASRHCPTLGRRDRPWRRQCRAPARLGVPVRHRRSSAGRALGRTPLCPGLSPGTVEGLNKAFALSQASAAAARAARDRGRRRSQAGRAGTACRGRRSKRTSA